MKISNIYKAHATDCTVKDLSECKQSVQEFLNLNSDIYWSLAACEQHKYKLVRHGHLMQDVKKGSKIIGIIGPDGKTLLAGARLTFAKHASPKALAAIPVTENLETTAIIQTLGAHPNTNGNGGGLSTLIFKTAHDWAKSQGITTLMGKLAYGNDRPKLNNPASFAVFTKAGFAPVTTPTQVGSDFYKSIVMGKPL